jgi:hypothetical protein
MRVIRRLFLAAGFAFAPILLLCPTLVAAQTPSAQTGSVQAVVDVTVPSGTHIGPLTRDDVRAAIRLASEEPAARRFLRSYVIWTRAGWGDGPLIGSFSTPFSRVVRAALNARAAGRTLTPEEVPPSLLVPEVQVIAMSQLASDVDLERSRVERIVFVRRDDEGTERVVEPLRTRPFTQHGNDAVVGPFTNAALIATFPLDVLTSATEIRVQFDRTALGSTASSTCRTCVMQLESASIR